MRVGTALRVITTTSGVKVHLKIQRIALTYESILSIRDQRNLGQEGESRLFRESVDAHSQVLSIKCREKAVVKNETERARTTNWNMVFIVGKLLRHIWRTHLILLRN